MSAPLDPSKVRESFALVRAHTPCMIHALVDALEARLLRDEALLAMHARVEQVMGEIAIDNALYRARRTLRAAA